MTAKSETSRPYRGPTLTRWFPHKEGLERAVIFEPGYNDRGGAYGVHGMGIRWLLRGQYGAVQFLINTGWVPGQKMSAGLAEYYPSGWDLGYHALRPLYDGQLSMGKCEYLDNDECWYDGSGMRADDLLHVFIREGELALWDALEDEYLRLAERTREADAADSSESSAT